MTDPKGTTTEESSVSTETAGAKKTPKSKASPAVAEAAPAPSEAAAPAEVPAAKPAARSGRKKSAAAPGAAPGAAIDAATPKAKPKAAKTAATVEQAAPDALVKAAPAQSPPTEKKPATRSRGRGKKAVEKAPPAVADAVPEALSTPEAEAVPVGSAPAEAASPDLADADEGAAETGEKKRRSRSRRGRGRKKSAAVEAAPGSDQAAEHEESGASGDSPLFENLPIVDMDDDEGGDIWTTQKDSDSKGKTPRRKMFVSVLPEEQIEVVLTEEGQVQEYYVEMLHQAKLKGNIYKGVVHNVDPNLQAAFVSYGAVKNGFLQIDEVHPEYYVSPHDGAKGRKYPPIQKVLKAGQEVLVQIVKEPSGTKGAFLTTYLSMPGRFLVLTPGREQIGVSRKVESETERARLRELLEGLSPGPGLGVIVRTVSMGASKTSLQRDLQYLKRTWKEVRTRGTMEKAPCLVYQEMDLTSRAVRDYLTESVGEVWIDDEATAAAVTEIAEALFPRKKNLVRVHKDTGTTLFERFNVQRQLDQIESREVTLPSGGRLVIDATEALTAIDINSGRSGGKSNFEDMAFRTNMEAARMIPLQLRLRDIGGQIVVDFIEMRDRNHWREVEKTLRSGMKVDRARHDVGKTGPFGMLEMVRQRLGSSAISISSEPCPCCGGTGARRNMEWRSQHSLRDILRLLRNAQAHNESAVTYSAEQALALHLLNNKRQRLLEMEQHYGVRVDIQIRHQESL